MLHFKFTLFFYIFKLNICSIIPNKDFKMKECYCEKLKNCKI